MPARAIFRLYPPVWFLVCLLGVYLAARTLPRSFGASAWTDGVGWILVAAGMANFCWALVTFARSRTTVLPFRSPEALLTTGPFAYSRNPIYLGEAFILLGVALQLGNSFAVLVTPVFMAVLQRTTIRWEEAICAAVFGDTYAAYRTRTHRWLGKKS